jgi:hypothetical protein
MPEKEEFLLSLFFKTLLDPYISFTRLYLLKFFRVIESSLPPQLESKYWNSRLSKL